jgi:hypothetical protein
MPQRGALDASLGGTRLYVPLGGYRRRAASFLFYRLNVTANNGNATRMQISEIQMFDQ